MRELEEGQINEWKTVSVEKAGRSPKSHDLKYGQVTIATPSRFAALRNSDEKGEEIEETQEEVTEVVEEVEAEDAEDTCQRKIEESIEGKTKEGEDEDFLCSFVYALNTVEERRSLWEDITSHYKAPMFTRRKWMIMGDFNEILAGREHSEFESTARVPVGMREFQEVTSFCILTDMGYHGPLFTWNHLRCRIQFGREEEKKRKPFKFTNAIAKMPEFMTLMEDYWAEQEDLFHSMSAMFRLTKRLKDLKQPLRSLSKLKLGDLSRRTRDAYQFLCMKQQETLENPNTDKIKEEVKAYDHWQRLADLEEEYLKQKSKLHWLEVGDGNNKAFHNSARIREIRNTIYEIQRAADGGIVKTEKEIKKEAERFFEDFMTTQPQDFEGVTEERLRELLDFECSDADKDNLMKEVTQEEIKRELFKMPGSKAPGPDGFTTEFFKEFWAVIGKDITVAVQSFFIMGFLPKGLNSTILTLVPKKTETKGMKDYRPISCCNVLYKLISKILTNRLKRILPKCISWNQSAFIKERLLMENVLLATEIVKDYHKEEISPRCAMMIDISKAFDSVQWPFLLNTLRALGLPERMTGLKISLEKSTLFLAGVSAQKQEEILSHFPFATGKLPVRYLGLPLLTKNMTVLDYLPLIEKIRKRIGSWTGRFLSYAGCLQLIQSVITSLANFWMAAFKLPSSCLKEIERLCSAFLWLGPGLNNKKAKVSWSEVSRTKQEGGLGLRKLKDVNLIYLIRKGSLWTVKENIQSGSWMWKKLLKYRDVAKRMYKVEVKNGKKTSFWFENWSSLGCLKDILGEGSNIDMGISINATVEESWKHRKREHRVVILNKVELEIELSRVGRVQEEDVSLWIWGMLMKGILRGVYTVRWEDLLRIMRDLTRGKMQLFLIKYMFQAAVYMIWRERNRRRHGEAGTPSILLAKLLDKNMRNKLTIIQRRGDIKMGEGMQYWFATR
ncbi:uncharacterized protein LOC125582236 [Brassica napus]|uniref:uncharacterized protein LOC125582236 n=1 Tax=Brassica napus TaxID=3708 RepID=UPI002078F8CE|nr:uncharacterized protein LOC125582236 [Brassica napus]